MWPKSSVRIRYEQAVLNYDSKFNQIQDPRLSLIKSNTLKDLKEQTFRRSMTGLSLVQMLS